MKLFSPSITAPLFYLALIRIAAGLTFLSHFADQVLGLTDGKSWLVASPLSDVLQRSMSDPVVFPFYRNFEVNVVLPNLPLFNYLLLLSELAVGISLTLGLFTRAGAVVALWLSANFMLIKSLPSMNGEIDHVLLVCELVILLANAGRVWGLDGMLFSGAAAPTPRAAPASRANAARA